MNAELSHSLANHSCFSIATHANLPCTTCSSGLASCRTKKNAPYLNISGRSQLLTSKCHFPIFSGGNWTPIPFSRQMMPGSALKVSSGIYSHDDDQSRRLDLQPALFFPPSFCSNKMFPHCADRFWQLCNKIWLKYFSLSRRPSPLQ